MVAKCSSLNIIDFMSGQPLRRSKRLETLTQSDTVETRSSKRAKQAPAEESKAAKGKEKVTSKAPAPPKPSSATRGRRKQPQKEKIQVELNEEDAAGPANQEPGHSEDQSMDNSNKKGSKGEPAGGSTRPSDLDLVSHEIKFNFKFFFLCLQSSSSVLGFNKPSSCRRGPVQKLSEALVEVVEGTTVFSCYRIHTCIVRETTVL